MKRLQFSMNSHPVTVNRNQFSMSSRPFMVKQSRVFVTASRFTASRRAFTSDHSSNTLCKNQNAATVPIP
jgi:hypothetical protein